VPSGRLREELDAQLKCQLSQLRSSRLSVDPAGTEGVDLATTKVLRVACLRLQYSPTVRPDTATAVLPRQQQRQDRIVHIEPSAHEVTDAVELPQQPLLHAECLVDEFDLFCRDLSAL
jgi:hypothetical protein